MEARHPLTPTEREPYDDIMAQCRALINPYNPKWAMWVSVGTPPVFVHDGYWIKKVELEAGAFYGSREDGARLLADPTEETLAELLGYIESKAAALAASHPHAPLIVQARDGKDGVVHEQLASLDRFQEAAQHASKYGAVRIMTMEACLRRRQRLIALEAKDQALRPR